MSREASVTSEVWVVDLDYTLIRTDSLSVVFFEWFRREPFRALGALIYYISIRKWPQFKSIVCENGKIDAARFPYRQELIHQIIAARKAGHLTVLATATHEKIALEVAAHLGIFDHALGTREKNLRGKGKLEAIRGLIGDRPFLYWGDSPPDYEIWPHCSRAGVVNPTPKMLKWLQERFSGDKLLVIRD